MNIRDLRYIVAVADLKSFVRAAEHCCVSQPTLSMQIKKLEESLGIKIFERNNKRVLITPIGQQVIDTAQTILQQIERLQSLCENAQDPLAGDLILGAFPTLAPYLLADLVPLITQQLPKLRLILVEEKTEVLLNRLKEGSIDVALLAAPIKDDGLVAEVLFEDPFKLAVYPSHPLSKNAFVNSADLIDQALLLLDEGHCLRDQALQFCQLKGIHQQQDLRGTSLETLRQMVRAGTGITFIPEIAIHGTDDGIRYVPFSSPPPSRSICLVWRKTSPRTELMAYLKEIILTLRK